MSPRPALDPRAAVVAGLIRAATAARDERLVADGERLYGRVRDRVAPIVAHAGEVVLAFPSMLLHPGERRECLVVVLPTSILIAARRRSVTEVLRIEKSAVARVEVAPPPLSVPFPFAATLEGGFGACVVGLPRGAQVFGGRLRGAVEIDS